MFDRFSLGRIETTQIHGAVTLRIRPRLCKLGTKISAAHIGAGVRCPTVSAAVDRYEALVAEIRAEFPRFRVVRKHQSRLQRAIDRALRCVTFGRMTAYLTHYQTTIGCTVYVTPDWDDRPADARYVTMRHERVHLRQFRRWTFPAMAVLYLFVPLPLGLAWCRARFEWAAYRETIAAAAEVYGPQHVRSRAFRESIVRQFTGPGYGWMWPFQRAVERWYDAALRDLVHHA